MKITNGGALIIPVNPLFFDLTRSEATMTTLKPLIELYVARLTDASAHGSRSEHERYLAGSVDRFELERRQRAWTREVSEGSLIGWQPLGRETGLSVTLALLILNGVLVAGAYALSRLEVLEGMSPLGLLYWQAVSSAIIVSAIAAFSGDRPRFSLRNAPDYAIAAVLGASPLLIAGYGGIRGIVPGVLLAAIVPLLLVGRAKYRARGSLPIGVSPLGAASGMLIAWALVLDPIVGYAHAIVLPGLSFARSDWALLAISAVSSGFYVTAMVSTARMAGSRVHAGGHGYEHFGN